MSVEFIVNLHEVDINNMKMEQEQVLHCKQKQCRTCLNQSEYLLSLQDIATFETSRQMSYGELLKEVTHLDITGDKWKEMPKYICHNCSERLQLSHAFIKQALEVNDKLWLMLPENDVEIKPCLEIKIESEEVMEQQSCEVSDAIEEYEFPVKTENSNYDSSADDSLVVHHNTSKIEDANNLNNITDKPEIKRKKYTQEDREMIVHAARRGENWSSLAVKLGINYKTAHRWVSSGRTELKPRGGKKSKKLTEDQVAILISWIENDGNLTLEQMTCKIRDHFNISVSTTTVGNYLEGRLYSCRRLEGLCISSVNSSDNKQKRAVYVQSLNRCISEGKQIAWMGDINLNLFCRMSRGRPKGQNDVDKLLVARGPNVHLIGVITSMGVLLLERLQWLFTSTSCLEWVYQILQKWTDINGNNNQDLVIICDNSAWYSNIELVLAKQLGGRATALRLPPYSPMLNPVESIWHKIKQNIHKSHMANVQAPILREQSLLHLEKAVDEAISTITTDDCEKAVHQTSLHYADVLSLNDLKSVAY